MKLKLCYIAAAMLLSCALAPALGWGQSADSAFDPPRPFANLQSADEWANRFRTGKPDTESNDRFRNLTSREWVDSWTKRPKGLSNEEFLRSYSGSAGSGVKVRSPYPYKSAQEHHDAWLAAANGGTRPTRANLPD